MASRKHPAQGGAKATGAKEAPRAKEATGAGGTGAIGVATGASGAATTRTKALVRRMPGITTTLNSLFFFQILGFYRVFTHLDSEVLNPS